MQQLNPFKYRTSLTVISLVWTAITAVHILFLFFLYKLPFEVAWKDGLIFNLLFAVFSIGVLSGLNFEDENRPLLQRILSFYVPLIAVMVTLWMLAGYSIADRLIVSDEYHSFLVSSMKYRVLIGLVLFIMVVIVQQLIHYYRNFQVKELKMSRLEGELQRSKVNTLQMQMQPHFLFNALNSISALTFEDADKTRQMLIKLSEFLRYTTKYSEKQLVKLTDELSHIDQYLVIERLRFGDRLQYTKQISKEAEERLLPCLVLQPIIENAIKHGVNQSIEPVEIRVFAKTDQDKLVVTIVNTKDGDSRKKGTGTGLKNLSNRLRILYGDRAHLQVQNDTDKFTVRIVIP
jgi:two-component system LytT family sensor kinase